MTRTPSFPVLFSVLSAVIPLNSYGADASIPAASSAAEACDIAEHPERHPGETLVLRGHYSWDWEWGAFLEFDDCKMPLRAPQSDAVRDEIELLFSSSHPMQGQMSGTFEGKIIRASTCEFQGKRLPSYRCDYFSILRVYGATPGKEE